MFLKGGEAPGVSVFASAESKIQPGWPDKRQHTDTFQGFDKIS